MLAARVRADYPREIAAGRGVASLPGHFYSPLGSERGAARLAHLSGGQGVASSNLAAPTSSPSSKSKKHRKKLPRGGSLFHARITVLSRPKAGRELLRTGETKNPAEGSSHASRSSSLLPGSLPRAELHCRGSTMRNFATVPDERDQAAGTRIRRRTISPRLLADEPVRTGARGTASS